MKNRIGKEIPPEQIEAHLKLVRGEFDLSIFKADLKESLKDLFEDWEHLKGWSLKTIVAAIQAIVTKAPNIVSGWNKATPEERRSAVVEAINYYVDVPFIPESIEAIAIGAIYDAIQSII